MIPPESHLISLIHAARSPHHLHQITAHLLRRHLAGNPILSAHLISASAPLRCVIPFALTLFHSFPSPSLPLFSALIRALSDSSLHSLALSHYILLPRSGLRPTRLSLPFALRSAASLPSSLHLLPSLHASALKPSLDLDPFVRTSLADAYVKTNSFPLALQLLDETPHWHKSSNPLLWNVAILAACRLGDTGRARIILESMPQQTLASWNSLIHGYIKSGDLDTAFHLFDRMPERNVVTWTTMVAGFSQNSDYHRALTTFYRMLDASVRPNDFTVSAALSACARMGALDAGVRIHEYAVRNGHRVNHGAIGTALIDMYSKCGKIDHAEWVFRRMSERDILTWTAMIMGYAMQGQWQLAVRCFEDMKRARIEPDEGAFLAVLIACSHSGKVEEGIELFDSMRFGYKIEPTVKHYTCMVDLFGRAGRLEEALEFMKAMPLKPDYIMWGALFCACRAHKNVRLAELAAEKLLQLKPAHPGGYVFLSNVYANAGRWEDVEKVRVDMKDKSIEKSPGWSYIEVEGVMHHFVAGDRSHPCLKEIHKKLEELAIRASEDGYRPNTEWVLHNIEEEDKQDTLGCHSEKLALAFGLLSTPEGADIRIFKNLRVCGDCHSLMKFVSRICRRQILLRDNKRFHHFREGECSCCDYW